MFVFKECCSHVKLQKNKSETNYIQGLGVYELQDNRVVNNRPVYINHVSNSELKYSDKGWKVS